jgi:hypothetical protein
MDLILSKEGQEMLVEFQPVPVRRDVEPKPARLVHGYQRILENPDDYRFFPKASGSIKSTFAPGELRLAS